MCHSYTLKCHANFVTSIEIGQNFEPPLANFYAIGQLFFAVKSHVLNKYNPGIWSH